MLFTALDCATVEIERIWNPRKTHLFEKISVLWFGLVSVVQWPGAYWNPSLVKVWPFERNYFPPLLYTCGEPWIQNKWNPRNFLRDNELTCIFYHAINFTYSLHPLQYHKKLFFFVSICIAHTQNCVHNFLKSVFSSPERNLIFSSIDHWPNFDQTWHNLSFKSLILRVRMDRQWEEKSIIKVVWKKLNIFLCRLHEINAITARKLKIMITKLVVKLRFRESITIYVRKVAN